MAGKKSKLKNTKDARSSKAPATIPHKENYARISYLHQVSSHLALNPQYLALSRGILRTASLVLKKTVLKLTPALKRSLCKGCDTILIPGLTMSMSLENTSKGVLPHADILQYRCLSCAAVKRFPVGKDRHYVLFSEREDVRTQAC